MTNPQTPFTKSTHCPVVVRVVQLSGTLVTLTGTSQREVTRRTCSNIEQCLRNNETIERIPYCLLHSLLP